MSDGISFDSSELLRLAADFGRATKDLLPDVDKVVKKGAQNLKDAYVAQARGSSFRGIVPSISYDSDYRPGRVQYEIGPDKDRSGGPLGNLYYFGGAHGGGGTGDLDGPLQGEAPRFLDALGDLAEDRLT